MSLRIWLPLNGTLENLGSYNVTVTTVETPTYTTGKIGQCYQRANSNSQLTNGINLNSNLLDILSGQSSIAVWVKPLGTHTHYNGTIASSGNWNANKWAFGVSQDNSKVDILCGGYNNYITCAVPQNEWTHLVSTFDNGTCKLYKNGEYIGQATGQAAFVSDANNACIGRETYANGYFGFNGCINDVRIYDHCLSAEEIREIANGLVLHYTLNDDDFEATTNISTGTLGSNAYNGATGKYSYGTTTDMYKTTGVFQGRQCTKVYMGTNNLSAYPYVWFDNLHPAQNAYKTLSFDYYPTALTSVVFYTYSGSATATYKVNGTSGTGGTIPVRINEWNHIELTLLGTSANTSGWGYMRIGSAAHTSSTSNYWLFDNIQIEEKDHATAYVVGSRAAGNITDNSGYHHHGTITGNISSASNSKRYSNCIYISSGNTDYITTTNEVGNFSSGITMNIWFKSSCTTPGSDYHEIFNIATATQNFEMAIYKTGYFRGGMVINGTRYVDNTNNTNILDGNWHMLTMTYDGTILRRYVDGIDKKDTTISGTLTSTSCKFLFGHYGTSTSYYAKQAYLSDVRIYCTALSNTEILKLYNSGMIFDKNKQIHTHKFNEFAVPALHKTAILDGQINEALYCPYDPNIYIEPDGSKWVHIFHQNNASSNLFASTDTFNTKVYKNENAWFYVSLCHHITSWEFLGVNKEETTSTEKRYRWIQNINPMVATFNDVPAANITRITNGYTSSSWGGLYRKNSSTCLCLNNAQSGNWWGAIGAWALSASGVPALTGTVTKTGYIDLYVRVDNTTFVNHILHNNIDWLADQFIEK